jgi:hypothetical protein
MDSARVPEYSTWGQVAGYFDGDGTIGFSDLSNIPYKLSMSLLFVDQSLDQIRTVRDFLRREGINPGNILKHHRVSAYLLVISRYDSVKKMLTSMLPFLCKKANEARAALDYYENRITGNELVAVFKQEVEAGRRERHQRRIPIDVPYALAEGLALMKEKRQATFRDAFGRFRSKVCREDFARIRDEYFNEGKRLSELAREYQQYSRETIRRVLGRGRGYVGVKGLGRVVTTDTTLRDPRSAQQ